jgi:hypothetical protein
MKHAPLALAVLALLAAASPGRTPADGEVPARLDSEVPAEIAWGAYRAGSRGRVDQVPRLIELLLPRPERNTTEWAYVRRSVLDALIRLEVDVPAEVLLPHATRFREPVLILLARDPARNQAALLAIFERGYRGRAIDPVTVAAGNLLAGAKSPHLAARLLPLGEMKLLISVRDDGSSMGIGGGISAGAGSGRLHPPEGFPPTVRYRLNGRNEPGSMLVAEGRYPVYSRRLETAPGTRRIRSGGFARMLLRSDLAPAWLGQLLGRGLDLRASDCENVQWSDAAGFLRDASALRDAKLTAYWKALEDLVEAKLLDVETARAAPPRLKVTIRDDRKTSKEPLPPLPPTTVRSPFPEEDSSDD